MSKEDSDVFNDIFENDLKKALDFVKKDIKMLQQKFYLQREENCVLQDTSMTMSDQIELSALGILANLSL